MGKSKKMELRVFVSDFLAMTLSYAIASFFYLFVFKDSLSFLKSSFWQTYSIFVISFFFSEFFTLSKNRMFLKRTRLEELYNVIKNVSLISIAFATFTFAFGYSIEVSRGVFLVTGILNILIGYMLRLVLRRMHAKISSKNKQKILVVTTESKARLMKIRELIDEDHSIDIIGFAIIDKNCVGDIINNFQVRANKENLLQFTQLEIVDSVLFLLDNEDFEEIEDTISDMQSMGIIINFAATALQRVAHFNTSLNFIGTLPVVSYSESLPTDESLIIKRGIDILGGLVGSAIAVLFFIIVGPIIKIESKGPILFVQKRVGKNGRYFNMYKFRSMCNDAEAKKKDLLEQNEVDGHMFKLTNDPRVTRIGKIIRATSIDELPQFFNVLKGDMSLVGTRPPTVEEFKSYSAHHKRRLSMKPGITGVWQVSGRSNIKNFEEVVRLDTEYIDNYTLVNDFKIIAKTVIVVIAKVGSK